MRDMVGELANPIKDVFKKGHRVEAIALSKALLLDMKGAGAGPQVLAGMLGAIFGADEAKQVWVNEFGWSLSRKGENP